MCRAAGLCCVALMFGLRMRMRHFKLHLKNKKIDTIENSVCVSMLLCAAHNTVSVADMIRILKGWLLVLNVPIHTALTTNPTTNTLTGILSAAHSIRSNNPLLHHLSLSPLSLTNSLSLSLSLTISPSLSLSHPASLTPSLSPYLSLPLFLPPSLPLSLVPCVTPPPLLIS